MNSGFNLKTHTFWYCEKNLNSKWQKLKIENKLENNKGYSGTNETIQKVLKEMFDSVECSIVKYPNDITLSDNGFSADGLTVKTRVASKLKCHHDGSPIYIDSSFCVKHKITDWVWTNVSVGLDYDVCYASDEWKTILTDKEDYLKHSWCLGTLPVDDEDLDSKIKKEHKDGFTPTIDRNSNTKWGDGIQPNFLINNVPVNSTYEIGVISPGRGVDYNKHIKIIDSDNASWYPSDETGSEWGAFNELGWKCLFSNFSTTSAAVRDHKTITTSGKSDKVYYIKDAALWFDDDIKGVSDLLDDPEGSYKGPFVGVGGKEEFIVYENQKRTITTRKAAVNVDPVVWIAWDVAKGNLTVTSKAQHDYDAGCDWETPYSKTYSISDQQDLILCLRPLAEVPNNKDWRRFMGVIKMPAEDKYLKDRMNRVWVPNFMICPSIDTILVPEQIIEDWDGSVERISALSYGGTATGRNDNVTTDIEKNKCDTITSLPIAKNENFTLNTWDGSVYTDDSLNRISVQLSLNDISYFNLSEFLKSKRIYDTTILSFIVSDVGISVREDDENGYEIHNTPVKWEDLEPYTFEMKEEIDKAIFSPPSDLRKTFIFDAKLLENRIPYKREDKTAQGYEDGAIIPWFQDIWYTITINNVRHLTYWTPGDYNQVDLYINHLIENQSPIASDYTGGYGSMVAQHYFHWHIPYYWFKKDWLNFSHDSDNWVVLDAFKPRPHIISKDGDAAHIIQVKSLKNRQFTTKDYAEYDRPFASTTCTVVTPGLKAWVDEGYGGFLPHSTSLTNIDNRMYAYRHIDVDSDSIPTLDPLVGTNQSLYSYEQWLSGKVSSDAFLGAASYGLTMGISLGKATPSGSYAHKLPSFAILLTAHNSNISKVTKES